MKNILAILSLFISVALRAQTTFYVAPHATDTAYTAAQDSSFVTINTSVTSNGKLLIFLDGSGSNTKNYTYFPKLAANMGYHAISVAYPNSPTVGSLCSPSSDSLCYDKVRQEICYGTDASTLISVDTFNSIYTRTVKLLQYLAATYPSQNWGAYISGGEPVWSNIVVSGHSQGSGHALYFAQTHACYRLIMFAGADDFGAFYNRPAHWLRNTSLTPVSSYYSFLHLQDDVVPYSQQYAIVQTIGMTASGDDSTIIDNKTIPYLNSHCLYSNALPAHASIASSYHDAPVVDFFTPVSGSSYLYDSVWYYMLTIPTTSGVAAGLQPALSIFPNPCNDVLYFSAPSTGDYTISITNLSGQTVYSSRRRLETNTYMHIDISKLSPGMYILHSAGLHTKFIKR